MHAIRAALLHGTQTIKRQGDKSFVYTAPHDMKEKVYALLNPSLHDQVVERTHGDHYTITCTPKFGFEPNDVYSILIAAVTAANNTLVNLWTTPLETLIIAVKDILVLNFSQDSGSPFVDPWFCFKALKAIRHHLTLRDVFQYLDPDKPLPEEFQILNLDAINRCVQDVDDRITRFEHRSHATTSLNGAEYQTRLERCRELSKRLADIQSLWISLHREMSHRINHLIHELRRFPVLIADLPDDRAFKLWQRTLDELQSASHHLASIRRQVDQQQVDRIMAEVNRLFPAD